LLALAASGCREEPRDLELPFSTAPPAEQGEALRVQLAASGTWLGTPAHRVMATPPRRGDPLLLPPLAEAVRAARRPARGEPLYAAELRIDRRMRYRQLVALVYTLGQSEIETYLLATDDGHGGRGAIRLDAPRYGERIPTEQVVVDRRGITLDAQGGLFAVDPSAPPHVSVGEARPTIPRRSDGRLDLAALTDQARALPRDGSGRITVALDGEADVGTLVQLLDALRAGGFDSPLLAVARAP
jgi:biopolymer transport protein ExbD